MRFTPTLIIPFLAAILVSSPLVSAHARPGGSSRSSSARSLAGLQYQPRPRLIDICLNIPDLIVDLLGPKGLLNIGGIGTTLNGLLGLGVNACLCLHDLDLYLKANVNVTLSSEQLADINALINSRANPNNQCETLPPHATRICGTANPCGIQCDKYYTLEYGNCKCLPPYALCNGVCGPPVAGCGASQYARSLRSRRAEISTYERAKLHCGKSEVCGVYGNPNGWECLDVTSSPDSCGGCFYPHPFSSVSPASRGVDCRAISDDMKCQNGKCVGSAGPDARRDLVSGLHGSSLLSDSDSASSPSTPPSEVLSPALADPIVAIINNTHGLTGVLPQLPSTGCVRPLAVSDALNSVYTVLGSDSTSLVSNAKTALAKVMALQKTVEACGCAVPDGSCGGSSDCDPGAGGDGSVGSSSRSSGSSSMGVLLRGLLGGLLGGLGDLLQHCPSDVLPMVPGKPSASCLNVDPAKLLCSLFHEVFIDPIFVCGELGTTLHILLQPLIDGLGLGLSGSKYCLKAPPSAPPVIDPGHTYGNGGSSSSGSGTGGVGSASNGGISFGLPIDVSRSEEHDASLASRSSVSSFGHTNRVAFRTRSGYFVRNEALAPARTLIPYRRSPASPPTSTVPAVVSSNSSNIIDPVNDLLILCLKINMEAGNMPFTKDIVKELNAAGMNPLLLALVGPLLLQPDDSGMLGGAVADSLGGKIPLSPDALKKLIDNTLSLTHKARQSSDCGCSGTADKLISLLEQLPSVYNTVLDAVEQCGCGGPPLRSSISMLLSQNPIAIKAFQRLNE
ncbi:hypothetical protein R3P38DRAFT_1640192 [Favolaschia claudopus]|uniref:Protein CPL1-like domain-containing protein n=1 Tax=Favolaschia claudopus TaxID=2862362 RepID=A0AAW0DM41_9AGAR